jgi:hypothetical protein
MHLFEYIKDPLILVFKIIPEWKNHQFEFFEKIRITELLVVSSIQTRQRTNNFYKRTKNDLIVLWLLFSKKN